MGRSRGLEELELSMDSFVDIIANTVGILVIFVIITMTTTKQALLKSTDTIKMKEQTEQRIEVTQAEVDKLLDEMGMTKDEAKKMLQYARETRSLKKELQRWEEKLQDTQVLALSEEVQKNAETIQTLDSDIVQLSENIDQQQTLVMEKSKQLKELEAQKKTFSLQVPPAWRALIESGQLNEKEKVKKTKAAARSAKKKTQLLASELSTLEQDLASVENQLKSLDIDQTMAGLEELRRQLQANDQEMMKLIQRNQELDAQIDNIRELRDHPKFTRPRRDVRVRKLKRIVFECFPEGVLYLYETDGRHVRINPNGYEWGNARKFPLKVTRTSAGESAVRLWKGNIGELPKSEFEKRLLSIKPSEYDLVFIVRSDSESYRNFRRARQIAEDQLGFVSQWNLVPPGKSLMLRPPVRLGLKGSDIARRNKRGNRADAASRMNFRLQYPVMGSADAKPDAAGLFQDIAKLQVPNTKPVSVPDSPNP